MLVKTEGEEQPLAVTEAMADDEPPHRAFAEHRDFDIINEAYKRIQNHRKLFRRDWLPFIEGVYGLSSQAWEKADKPTKLDGKPDWGNHHVKEAFRALTWGQPWASYFKARRSLLQDIRAIGEASDFFLVWYDGLPEETREKVGYPETLWRMYAAFLKSTAGDKGKGDDQPDPTGDNPKPTGDDHPGPTGNNDQPDPTGDNPKPTGDDDEPQSVPVSPLAEALRLLITYNNALPRMNDPERTLRNNTVRDKVIPQLIGNQAFDYKDVEAVGQLLIRVGQMMSPGKRAADKRKAEKSAA